ncbi:hypothetical protein ACFQ08_16780 [Streptosporangium algeriense]|uniref:DUF4190 domain-containing protein n=1 Tax=Streptosporangium algeriense TaxID=1682748 RepID=A0ABW3DT39_9ACTN
MSSGPPEGPSANPDDWKSPYSTGPGQAPGYDAPAYGRPAYDQSPAYGQPPAYGLQNTQPSPGSGQQQPAYDPGYAQDHGQGYGQPAYDQGYGHPGHPVQGYGESPYGQYPPAYGPGPYPGPPQNVEGVKTHAIIALVISILLGLSCYVSIGGITGAILSALALGKVERDPQGARGLLKWTWISIGINVGLVVLGVGGIIVAGVSGAFD